MRRKDTRPQFQSRLAKREAKVATLKAANNPEARKQLRRMNDVMVGKVAHDNVAGYWVPRKSSPRPVKCTVKSKARHTTVAHKRIMRGV